MKILFITSSSINGGAQKHIRDMFRSISKRGHDVYLAAPEGWLTDELREYSDKVICMDIGIRTRSKLSEMLDIIDPDITNTFILSGGVFGTLSWKKKRHGKLFVTVNNQVIYPGVSSIRKLAYPSFYKWMSKYASAFLVKSETVGAEVSRIIKRKRPVISIKNGIDFDVFNTEKQYPDLREKFSIKKEETVIVNVAALNENKGQEYLIDAVVRLNKEYPVRLLLVGDGDDGDRLKKNVKEKEADSFIGFLGRRNDVNAVLAASDIFVLPSLHEGLPNALLEAMAMGLPCVASNVGGVPEIISDDTLGILTEAGSSKELYSGLKKLIDDKENAVRIGNNGRKKVFDLYKQDAVTDELLMIYTCSQEK